MSELKDMPRIAEEFRSEGDTERQIGHTVFELLASPVVIDPPQDEGPFAGPTQNPTYLGGQFMGIDQDYQ